MTDRVPRNSQKLTRGVFFSHSVFIVKWWEGGVGEWNLFMHPAMESYEVEEFDNVFISVGVDRDGEEWRDGYCCVVEK